MAEGTDAITVADLAADASGLEVSEIAFTGSKRRFKSHLSSSSHPSKKAKSSGSDSQFIPPAIDSCGAPAKKQLGGYALEMLSSTMGTRMHALGVIVRDDLVSLWYFDASEIVRTCSPESGEKLSLLSDLERVAAIVVALSYCTPEQLGSPPMNIIRPPEVARFPGSFPLQSLAGCTIDLSNPGDNHRFSVTLSEHLYTQYVLMGRRSRVYTAVVHEEATIEDITNEDPDARIGGTAPDGLLNNGREVVVKLSQQPPGRTSEVELIKQAKDAGVKHLPEIIKCKDLWELCAKDGIRYAFSGCGFDDVDNRTLRCIVTPRYTPLSEQLRKDPDSLIDMAKQLIECEYTNSMMGTS